MSTSTAAPGSILMADGSYFDMTGITVVKEIDPNDYIGFGLRNSNIYRQMLFDHFQAGKVDAAGKFMVFVFCLAVKNRSRILSELNRRAADWQSKAWYKSVKEFFNNRTVQYTTESDVKMPVVNIPNSHPTLAAMAWFAIKKPEDINRKTFLENLFACQFKGLSTEELNHQMEWEKSFWNNTVKKTKNPNLKAYEASKGFQEEYWRTKSADEYILSSPDGKETWDFSEFDKWIDSMATHFGRKMPDKCKMSLTDLLSV